MGRGTASQPAGAHSVTARAPGKINLCFRAGAPQENSHREVASLYQAVSVYEEVTATVADDFSVSFSGPFDCLNQSTDNSNLALRAARLLAETTGWPRGAALNIVKRVPVSGGMGGGSADAAATLVACDELWGTGLGRSGLLPLAEELGAEVPFALEGGTAVRVSGGDRLSHALAKGEFHWVLVPSHHGLEASKVYRELDCHRERNSGALRDATPSVSVDAAVLQAVRSGDAVALAEVLHNDLQAAALKLRPELAEMLEFGESRGALAGIISGSGPTCAFLMPDVLAASELFSAFKRIAVAAVVAKGPVQGAQLVDTH